MGTVVPKGTVQPMFIVRRSMRDAGFGMVNTRYSLSSEQQSVLRGYVFIGTPIGNRRISISRATLTAGFRRTVG